MQDQREQQPKIQEVEEDDQEIEEKGPSNAVTSVSGRIKKVLGTIAGMLIPCLTVQRGQKKLSAKKSILVVMFLYISHSFSTWGDRMWGFAVSLFLALLYPGSLLLPGIHGFLVQFSVAIFGTIIGDWVDYNKRMKVAAISLMVQNGLLSLCSVVLAVMFYYDLNVCLHITVFSILSVIVIILAAGSNLATVANTISIEKDWVVALADGNEDTLAVLNANMRRIDLCCKLLAPALTGVILQNVGPFATTVVVAVWNVVSFFGELGLLWIIYKLMPSLAKKKLRKSNKEERLKDEENNEQDHPLDGIPDTEDEFLINDEDGEEGNIKKDVTYSQNNAKCSKICKRLLSFFSTFKDGWKIYIRQDIAIVGFSMASIYLTVLGFSGVTSSYFLIQGLRNDLIGLFQGVGAIFGVLGTIAYPFLRKKFGTIRTGLFGISTQLLILSFCLAAIIVPSKRISSQATGYYSPDCGKFVKNVSTMSVNESTVLMICPSVTVEPISQTYSIAPSQSNWIPSSTALISPTPTPSPSKCSEGNPTPTPALENMKVSISLILMLIGVVGCRIGLWTYDLAVQQLVQEKVVEEERGVVSGVMNAMNSIMDMLHYVLVIASPRPENFNILTAISFFMVALGWLLYCIYVRKSRGHFFHFKDCLNHIKRRRQMRIEHGVINVETEDSED